MEKAGWLYRNWRLRTAFDFGKLSPVEEETRNNSNGFPEVACSVFSIRISYIFYRVGLKVSAVSVNVPDFVNFFFQI